MLQRLLLLKEKKDTRRKAFVDKLKKLKQYFLYESKMIDKTFSEREREVEAKKAEEVLLPETSSRFDSKDFTKINFAHHKGVFGGVAMLKEVADKFEYGSTKTFNKVKFFFIHGANTKKHLWSLHFELNSLFEELWRERSLQTPFRREHVLCSRSHHL